MEEYVALLRGNPNYRFLWLGSVITQLGDWFNLLASAELITRLTSTGTAVSYLFLARFLPLFLFSPIAGVLADRYDRRYIMIATDVLRAATVLCFLFIRSPQQIWLLYALTLLQFALSSLFTPARSAVLANMVAPEELITANALDSLTWSTMLALGAFLGGLVAAVFGSTAAFVIDSLTYLVSAWAISRILVAAHTITAAATSPSRQHFAFIEGLRYLRGAPFILGISLAKGAGSLVWGAINVLEISFANRIFPLSHSLLPQLNIEDAGTATLGIIYVASGLGTGLGPLLVRRWLGDSPMRMLWSITIGFSLLVSGVFGLSAAPNLTLFVLATLIRTVGTGVIWVFSAALLQTIVPDQVRGRVFAFEFAFLTLTQTISILAGGVLEDWLTLTLQEVTAVMGMIGVMMGLLWAYFHFRARSAWETESFSL